MSGDQRAFDDLDRRLVDRLRMDGRESNRSLARALEVNEATVAARLRRMERNEMMRVVAVTDFEAFGYGYLAFGLITVAGRPALDVAAQLATIPESISVTIATGRFDIVLTVLARDRSDLARITGEVVPAVSGVAAVRYELALDVLRYDSKWSSLRAIHAAPPPPLDAPDIDELDLAIIALLQHDARASNRRIASDLEVSEGTVRARLRRLEGEQRIRIQAISDVEVFGLASHAFVGVHAHAGRAGAVARVLLDCPEVVVLTRSLGEFEFMAVVVTGGRQEMIETLLGRIQRHHDVRGTETLESCGTLKHAYTWARIGDRPTAPPG